MKFTHLADCHLGSWTQPELRELNFRSFQQAIEISIKEKVKFILISGDLFDSPYPSIEILKQAFYEFKKLFDNRIPVFLIPGSHDYSVSGRSFLEVLEKAGFCKNVANFEEKNSKIFLSPTIYENIAFYGYPGKRSGLEVNEIEKMVLQDSPGLFKILLLHTTFSDSVSNEMIKSANPASLPKVDYVALGHLHTRQIHGNRIYPGPTFPNNISELEELKHGSFYIINNGEFVRHDIKLKEVEVYNFEVSNAFQTTEQLVSFLKEKNLEDKIIIVKLSGIIEQGKISDIDFERINTLMKEKKVFSFLRNTSKLHIPEIGIEKISVASPNFEEEIIKKFQQDNPSKFNNLIYSIMKPLQIEKAEDERLASFEERLLEETKQVLKL